MGGPAGGSLQHRNEINVANYEIDFVMHCTVFEPVEGPFYRAEILERSL